MTTRAMTLFGTSIGKKAVMAGSGVVLFGFVIVHMIGNLQVFAGPEKLNAYAHWLHSNPSLVWGFRIGLLVAVAAHVVTMGALLRQSRSARAVPYRSSLKASSSTYASRSMRLTGPLILAFVVYHLLHYTTGHAHPSFRASDVYHNVIVGFSNPIVSLAYVVAMVLLGLHLFHGIWSVFQTLGLNGGRWDLRLRRVAAAATGVIVAGNISMPIAVLAGIVR